jgi:hypothetical protein
MAFTDGPAEQIGRGEVAYNTPIAAAPADGCGVIAVGQNLAFTSSPVATQLYVGQAISAALDGIGAGVSDHGELTGLGDDDHTQYFNASRLATAIAGKANLSGASFTGELQVASPSSLYRQLQLTGGSVNTVQTFTDTSTGASFSLGTANSKFYLTASPYVFSGLVMAASTSGVNFSDDSNLYGAGRLNCEVASGATQPALHCLVRGSAGTEDMIRVGTWSGAVTGRWRSNGSITIDNSLTKGVRTVSTLPSASANPGAELVVTDSAVAAAGNYGATVSGGGANRVKVFSNGTNWVIA